MKLLSRGFRDHKEGLLENILDRRQESMRVVAPRAGAVSVGSIHATVSVTVGRALETSPPVFIYCLALQESFGAAGAGGVRILSGGSDGRIKVRLIPSVIATWQRLHLY